MPDTSHKGKVPPATILAALLALFFAIVLMGLFFIAVFYFRPRFEVAVLSTAAFTVLLLTFIYRIEPLIVALALVIYPHYPLAFSDSKARVEPAPSDIRMDDIEEEIRSLDSRTDLSKFEIVEYMGKLIQRQKLAAERLKTAAEETSDRTEKKGGSE